jgi:inner membrane protein
VDNVTHALAGALMGAAAVLVIERRTGGVSPPLRRAAVLLGVVAAELPDIDLVYAGQRLGMGSLGYLLHHRGHTHTVVFAVAAALLSWGVALAWRPELRPRAVSRPLGVLALVGTLSHLPLDYSNSYGVHPWWPFDNRWFYGDAIFILEPWLWVVSLGPLLASARGRGTRTLWGGLLALILAVAWGSGMVARSVALVVSIGAIAWVALAWRTSPSGRLLLAAAGWLVIESAFWAAAVRGRQVVADAGGRALVDAVLTPAPGDPTCLRALVMTLDGDTLRVARGMVAPWPSLHSLRSCAGGAPRRAEDGRPLDEGQSPARWSVVWSGSREELRGLTRDYCEVAAALRYMRIPIWRRLANGRVLVSDARYGEGSFASLVATPDARCRWYVPSWQPPRGALLSP